MKKFSLRFLLGLVSVIAIVVGTTVHWYQTGAKQKRNVEQLIFELGGFYEDSPALPPFPRVTVLYESSLEWEDSENRYMMTDQLIEPKRQGTAQWIRNKFGRDFVEKPIAIEIDCHEFGRESLPDELVEQIRKLTSIRQIWMADRRGHGKGNEDHQIGPTNTDLGELFPNLIVASPQR